MSLTDAELQDVMREIKVEHPQCGNLQMKGILLSKGLRVQQKRIRDIAYERLIQKDLFCDVSVP